jgi:hypothetical protein
MMRLRTTICVVGAAATLVASIIECHAQTGVTVNVSKINDNYRYDYTVSNQASTPVSSFSIDVGNAPATTTAPAGWTVQLLTTSERHIVQWVASSAAADIQPSAVVAGFSLTSFASPGPVTFNVIDEDAIVSEDASTSGPSFLPAQLANIATRLQVGTGSNVLIAGFIITGSQNKSVLIRGIGPSLASVGLTGLLPDPLVELHGPAGETIAINNDWHESVNEADISNTTIPPNDAREGAVFVHLSPGAYTAVVKDAATGTGIGLVEVYDLDRGADAKLANISTRGFVDTGNNVMIGGTIILGSAPAKVLIRAIGPSLGAFGISNPLLDPVLELHDGNGALIRTNDDWRSTQETEIIATTIPPTDDRESAVVETLVPGAYTAVVAGKDNSTGVALVEAYQLQ